MHAYGRRRLTKTKQKNFPAYAQERNTCVPGRGANDLERVISEQLLYAEQLTRTLDLPVNCYSTECDLSVITTQSLLLINSTAICSCK